MLDGHLATQSWPSSGRFPHIQASKKGSRPLSSAIYSFENVELKYRLGFVLLKYAPVQGLSPHAASKIVAKAFVLRHL